MQKRYFFIGDSHPKFLVAASAYREGNRYIYLLDGRDEAISFYVASTMYSFPGEIDAALEATRKDFSEFQSVLFVYGTNDAMKIREGGLPLEECVERYLDKVIELSTTLQLPRPIVLSPTPARNTSEEVISRFKLLDTLLASGCLDRNLEFLSMHPLLALPDGSLDPQYSLDDIHFNNLGKTRYLSHLDSHIQAL